MFINTGNYNYQDQNYQNGNGAAAMLTGIDPGGKDDVFTNCKHYSPTGTADVINMENYTMCDSCRHKRMDEKCGVAEKTLM